MAGARCGAGHVGARLTALAVLAGSGFGPGAVYGQHAIDTSGSAFACMDEARSFVHQRSAGEVRAELDRQLEARAEPEQPAIAAAHRWCVAAELMRTLGDDRAPTLYARAIAATGEPGYELRLADYFRTARGPRTALTEQAEQHYQAALDGVRAHAATPGVADGTIAEWATRGLMLTYQDDGVTLLPWTAFPSDRATSWWPSVALMFGARIAVDTNHTSLDPSVPPEADDARRFTSEAMSAVSRFRKAQPLRDDELQAIARAPLRDEIMVRGRIRTRPIGAIDIWYRRDESHGGAITDYRMPTQMNDIAESDLGVGFARALDLAPAFDALLAGAYRRVHRVSVVQPGEDFDVVELRPAAARFVGPDKLCVAASYAIMAIPDVVGGLVANRARGRTIAAVNLEYAWNRLRFAPLRLPTLRVVAGAAQDDETFGMQLVRHRDAYLGLETPRLASWDVTVQGALFSSGVDVRPTDPAQFAGEDPGQRNAQYRTTVVLLRRLIDEEARPGLPPEVLAVRPSLVNLVVTLRHDVALRGLAAYQNVRAGLALSAKAFVTHLHGAALRVSVGYDNQYFYSIGKDLHVAHLDMRVGW